MEVSMEYSVDHPDDGITIYPENNEELQDILEFLQDHGILVADGV